MMSHKAEENKYERPQAYANSGLESLAAEASRRAESMDADLDARGNNNDNTENEPKSPTRSSGPRGKVRKAYTITKQRERWTEEEHDRFLQALKRYGRAWRKIEEHIGTKTAVQIRSHAQKFFSKLQREQSMNGGKDESSKNDISIPPPRPKRKPMHPYPRNSVDNSSEARGDQGRQIRHQAPEAQHRKDSGATTSTQVPTSNNQYSNSSGYQSGQPGAPSHFPLFHGQPSPFAGLSMAQQPSQVQLPPFPTLDTSSGENMTKVLKDAAMAAASAWNQVIAGASQKIQHQIQAQSYNPGIQSAPSLPMWNMSQQYPEQTEQNPFMRQLLSQLAAQQAANQQFMHGSAHSTHGPALFPASTAPVTSSLDARNTAFNPSQSQRYKQLFEGPGRNEGPDSDRDSLGSEEGTRASKSAFNTNIQGGLAYWSNKQPYTAAEAKLGRTAWEMMNRVTAQKSREAAKQEEAQNTSLMKAPSPGASGGSRRIMKPVPHSARISPLHDLNSGIQSAVHSDTSQLAHYYQRAAAAERDSRSPENYGIGSSANGDNGSSGDLENGFAGNNRKSDKGSNNGTGSDEANGNIVKDQGSNGSNEGASPKMKDLKVSTLDKANKSSNDDLASNFVAPTKGNLPGSDKGSHNGSGSGSDEDGQANGSELAAAGGEEKGSNDGSNDGQQSPRESSPVKNGSRSASKAAKRPQNEEKSVHANNPHSAEANWAAASFHNQQQACQEALKQGRPTQADMVQQILPFTLTPQQHQAISTWAAANSQSQPHQYRLMQSLLNGLTNPSSEYPAMAGNRLMDRQISGLTSADTGSNTECNTAAVLGRGGLGLDSRASAPAGDYHKPGMDLPKRPSGFQPYSSKRPADSTISAPAPKRFAGGNSLSDHPESRLGDSPRSGPTPQSQDPRSACKRDAYTPFGAQAIQSGQVHS